MTLFCVRDGDAANDSGQWNQPLKKVEKTHDPKPIDRYEKTGTPGVVVDRTTGKMETQIPDNEIARMAPVPPAPEYVPIRPRREGKSIFWQRLIEEQIKAKQLNPTPKVVLKSHPALLIMDDIKDQTDPTDFSDWLNTPEVKSYLKTRNGHYFD